MKGLILKDLIALKKQGRIALLLFVFYFVFSIVTKNTSMFGSMVAVICAMLPITTMSYDEFNKWDKYALSLPIQRKTVVLSKYILAVGMILAASVLVSVTNLIMMPFVENAPFGEMMLIAYGISMATILLTSVVFPILFKFGVEKGRLLMMIVVFAPVMLGLFVSRLNIPMPDEQLLKMLAYASPVIILCLLLISINISTKIYIRKEF